VRRLVVVGVTLGVALLILVAWLLTAPDQSPDLSDCRQPPPGTFLNDCYDG
jgi:hypothetical protein